MASETQEAPSERFIGARHVRNRYGVSDMWIVRRLKDASGFPKPIQIAGRRFWKLSALEEWERRHASTGRG